MSQFKQAKNLFCLLNPYIEKFDSCAAKEENL